LEQRGGGKEKKEDKYIKGDANKKKSEKKKKGPPSPPQGRKRDFLREKPTPAQRKGAGAPTNAIFLDCFFFCGVWVGRARQMAGKKYRDFPRFSGGGGGAQTAKIKQTLPSAMGGGGKKKHMEGEKKKTATPLGRFMGRAKRGVGGVGALLHGREVFFFFFFFGQRKEKKKKKASGKEFYCGCQTGS